MDAPSESHPTFSKVRMLLLAGGIVVVMITVATVVLSTSRGSEAPAGAGPLASTTAVQPASPTPPPTRFAGDLRSLLLPRPVDGQPVTYPLARGGRMDLAAYVKQLGGEDQTRVLLEDYDFRQAVVGGWREPDGTTIDIELIEFGRTTSSLHWQRSVEEGGYMVNAYLDQLGVDGIDRSGFYIRRSPNGHGNIQAMATASHNFITMFIYVETPVEVNRAKIVQLMHDQYGRLP